MGPLIDRNLRQRLCKFDTKWENARIHTPSKIKEREDRSNLIDKITNKPVDVLIGQTRAKISYLISFDDIGTALPL